MTNTISCPVCNNICSVEATSCPKCGHPFQKAVSLEQNGVNNSKNIWKILTVALGVVCVIGLISYGIYSFAFAKSNLTIKAALLLKSGNPQPVSRTKFQLVNVDVATLAKESGLPQTDINLYNVEKVEESVNKHTIATVTTDFEGKAVFESVPKGNYTIYGFTGGKEVRHLMIWLLPVQVNGNKEILLDQNNAVVSSSF